MGSFIPYGWDCVPIPAWVRCARLPGKFTAPIAIAAAACGSSLGFPCQGLEHSIEVRDRLKTHSVSDFGHAQIWINQEVLGFIDSRSGNEDRKGGGCHRSEWVRDVSKYEVAFIGSLVPLPAHHGSNGEGLFLGRILETRRIG